MSVESYLTNLFQLLPPGETLVLTREKWEWMVAHHGGAPRDDSSADGLAGDHRRSERALYFVSDLAREFHVAESTMRAYISRGLCGDPTRLRPNGKGRNLDGVSKRFEVPAPLVAAVRDALTRGQVLGTFSIVPNVALRAAQEPAQPSVLSGRPDDTESDGPPRETVVATPGSGRAPAGGDGAPAPSPDIRPATKESTPARAQQRSRPRAELTAAAPKPNLGSWRKHLRTA